MEPIGICTNFTREKLNLPTPSNATKIIATMSNKPKFRKIEFTPIPTTLTTDEFIQQAFPIIHQFFVPPPTWYNYFFPPTFEEQYKNYKEADFIHNGAVYDKTTIKKILFGNCLICENNAFYYNKDEETQICEKCHKTHYLR